MLPAQTIHILMPWQAWFTLATILVMIAALVREWARVDVTILLALGTLLVAGVVSPIEAFSGVAWEAVITIASLYVVAAGIHQTGILTWIDRWLVQPGGTVTALLFRVMAPTAVLSAFLNNTPVVAMLIPRMQAVARKTGISVSKLLMPLSFAAIAGGMITLIGTSTNIIASGLIRDAGLQEFGLFEFAWIGLPVAALTVLYLSLVGHRLMPDAAPGDRDKADTLDYRFHLCVPTGSRLAGMSIQKANLRSLGDAYLVYIRRDQDTIGPVAPEEIIREADILTFIGRTDARERLLRETGFFAHPTENGQDNLETEPPLFQAVVSTNSTLAGKTLKDVNFREKYEGVVLAIHRRDESIRGALGNVPLKSGDLLVIDAQKGFDRHWRQSQGDFYLVTQDVREQQKIDRRTGAVLAMLAILITLHIVGVLPLAAAAFAGALGMILIGFLRGAELRQSVDMGVILTIAGAFGIGHAVQASGLATGLGHTIAMILPGQHPLIALLFLYLGTMIVTETITNSAAVVIMIPIALATAIDTGMEPRAVALAVTIAASASFLSPLGYQTNLMVMGAGGYRFRDYFRAGLPVSIAVMAITLTAVYLKWL